MSGSLRMHVSMDARSAVSAVNVVGFKRIAPKGTCLGDPQRGRSKPRRRLESKLQSRCGAPRQLPIRNKNLGSRGRYRETENETVARRCRCGRCLRERLAVAVGAVAAAAGGWRAENARRETKSECAGPQNR